jgi:hypothetical protein
MSTQIQRRRGTTAEHSTFTGVEGELTVDTTKDTAVVHDGTTVGGHPLQKQYPPLGSAAAPTYTFTGDTNTGIYSPGADQVAVSTGGTGRLFVDANGNVGLGTATTNWSLLDGLIVQTGNGYAGINIASSSATDNAYLAFGYGTTAAEQFSASIGRVGNNTLVLGTNNAERLRITSAGLVGIGTSSPTQSLTVAGNILTTSAAGTDSYINVATTGVQNTYLGFNNSGSTTGNAVLNNYSYVGSGNAYGLQLLAGGTPAITIDSSQRVGINTTSPSSKLSISTAANSPALDITDASTSDFIITPGVSSGVCRVGPATGAMALYTGNTERLRITSAGLVGIGVSSPGDVLHVKGGSTYAGIIADNSAATGGGAFRAYRNGVQKAIFCADSWVTGTSSDDAAIYADAGGGIKFYTNNSSTAKAVLTSGGSLGIGTTSPLEKLHVSGGSVLVAGELQGVRASSTALDYSSSQTRLIAMGPDASTTAPILFLNGTSSAVTEKARIDSSGRLLVGTSSWSGDGKLIVQANTSNSAGEGSFGIVNGSAAGSISSGNTIGNLDFMNNAGGLYARISAQADAAGAVGDHPGRLVFSTTADGASSPTERMRITSTGQVRLAGAGITFNGDTAAANALDDYEEGTWTPSVGGTATYTHQDGRYTKIGNTVHVSCRFTINLIGTGSTSRLSGLPFASENLGFVQSLYVSYYADITDSVAWIAGYVENAASTILFTGNQTASTTIQNNGVQVFKNSANIFFSATYSAA